MRFLAYADLHSANIYSFNVKKTKYKFSEYSRIDELYSTLDWIQKLVKQSNTMMAINLGDTFHQALRFYIERYNTVVKSINNINQSTLSGSGVVIEGNHDRSENVSAIDTFDGVSSAILVRQSVKIKYISEINSNLIFVPYIRDPEKTKEIFKTLYDKFSGAKTNQYLFCHLDVKEAYEGVISSTYQMGKFNSYNDLNLDIYKAVFSGHIHFKKQIKNLYYIGSVLNHNFGDALTRKGVSIIDIEPDSFHVTYKENPYCPLFVKINLEREEDVKRKIDTIQLERKKFDYYTNIYARIYCLNSEESKKKLSKFINDYSHLFTSYETKNLDSEEEMSIAEIAESVDNINIFDLIVEHGTRILKSQGKNENEIEAYTERLKNLCHIN